MCFVIIAILISLAPTNATAAEITVAEALRRADPGQSLQQETDAVLMQLRVASMLSALLWANAYLQNANKEKFYCEPDANITPRQAFQILADAMKVRPDIAADPLGMALIWELGRAFPCPIGHQQQVP